MRERLDKIDNLRPNVGTSFWSGRKNTVVRFVDSANGSYELKYEELQKFAEAIDEEFFYGWKMDDNKAGLQFFIKKNSTIAVE